MIREGADLFALPEHREEIIQMEGFGEKSFERLTESLERARNTTLPRLLYGLGIPNVGVANAKVICRYFGNDIERIRNASAEEFGSIDTIGPVIGKSLADYFSSEENERKLDDLLRCLVIEKEETVQEQTLEGKNFVNASLRCCRAASRSYCASRRAMLF